MNRICSVLFLFLFLFISENGVAQKKVINGIVTDAHSNETLPFSNIIFKHTPFGETADSAGNFKLEFDQFPGDTVVISNVSYKPYTFVIPKNVDTVYVKAALESGIASLEIEIKAKLKHTRGWYLWREVVRHKNRNNIFKNDNFTYHVYNRLEVDMNNIDPKKIQKSNLLRPFSKVLLQYVDSSTEEKPILPIFFTETVSDYFYQKEPYKTKEIIIANKISGVKNESLTQFLGAINQNVVIYGNFIPVFDKQFVSPLNENGDNYYNYRLADTQYVAGRRLLHLIFIPKHSGQSTFTGDCWVNDTTFAIQKAILHLNKDANINFVEKLSVVQEFKLINDSTWFLSKDKFFITFNLLGSSNTGFIARKTTNYDSVITNTPLVVQTVKRNKVSEEVEVRDSARTQSDKYWESARLEQLATSEKGIYKMVDTIQSLPAYKRYYDIAYFAVTGYKNIGKFQIGPWSNWISFNGYEDTRFRFDLGTTKLFSNKIYLDGYLAYGVNDNRFKHKIEALWLLGKKPWETLSAYYKNDIDFTQNYISESSTDNILATLFRRNYIPFKFLNIQDFKAQYFKDSKIGLSTTLTFRHREYTSLLNLPTSDAFTQPNAFNTTEVSIGLRWGYIEKFFENNFFRYSLGSDYPIPELEFTQGVSGILNSPYQYQKIKFGLTGQHSLAPLGTLNYNFFGGKIFGTLPYMFLEVHPGNELYFYNSGAFNLMQKYEFISDQYAGFALEHDIGIGLFRFIPLTRRLKFRQFWTAKGVIGSLNDANKQLNYVGNYNFKSLDNKLYLEVGTGVDNIFKVLRVDFVCRLLPLPLPAPEYRFGIFGSVNIQL